MHMIKKKTHTLFHITHRKNEIFTRGIAERQLFITIKRMRIIILK